MPNNKGTTVFATNLKYYIEMSGKEQKQICADLKIPESSLSDYVRGKSMPRYKNIEVFAKYFGVELSDLLLDGEKNAKSEQKKLLFKQWEARFPDVIWTKEEVKEILQFAEFVLAKRRE